MYNSLSYKSKQFFWLIIKLLIVIGCGYFIYIKLIENEELKFSVFYQNLIINDVFSTKNILFILIFTLLNWVLEIHKWKVLASFTKKNSLVSATIQSLASLTVSLITPNRIGEYGAKALYFEKKDRKQIVGLNLIGNFYQMFMTVFFGIIGFSYFVFNHKIELNFYQFIKGLFLGILIVLIFFLIAKFYNFKGSYLERMIFFLKKIPLNLKLKVGALSFLRFVVFSHQLYFLLVIFKVDVSYIDAISAICSVYLIASVIPMLSLFDFVLKGSVAVWVFSFFTIHTLTILSITSLMWIFNFVFPTIIGSYFVLTFKPNLAK